MIAVGISPFNPGSADVSAGKAMLARLDGLSAQGIDFSLETTLSGRWSAGHIPKWQAGGYIVDLHFLRLPSPEVSLARVRKRVSQGGHNIPEDVIRRRFGRSLLLFDTLYKNLVDDWFVYDNSGGKPILLDSGVNER